MQIDETFLGGQASGRGTLGRHGKVVQLVAVSAAPGGKAARECLSRQSATGEGVVVFSLNERAPGGAVVSDDAPSFDDVKGNQVAKRRAIPGQVPRRWASR